MHPRNLTCHIRNIISDFRSLDYHSTASNCIQIPKEQTIFKIYEDWNSLFLNEKLLSKFPILFHVFSNVPTLPMLYLQRTSHSFPHIPCSFMTFYSKKLYSCSSPEEPIFKDIIEVYFLFKNSARLLEGGRREKKSSIPWTEFINEFPNHLSTLFLSITYNMTLSCLSKNFSMLEQVWCWKLGAGGNICTFSVLRAVPGKN
jgi:hypothetical protein